MKLACNSVSVNLHTRRDITSHQKVELKPTRANKSCDTVPAEDAIQIGNLLNGARQSAQQGKQEEQLSNFTSTRETETDTLLHECLGRQQEIVKKANQLRKRLQLIQAKHVECRVQCTIQDLIESQRQTEINKIASSRTESAYFAGIKHSDSVQAGFIPNPINSELSEYTCFSKALFSHIEKNVDSDATISTDEDSDSEDISLKRNMPFEYRSEWRWTIDRAEIASRWTWLQAQISELEYRIRQINEIYRHICAAKEMVILDDSQPSKAILKKQTHLTDAAALLAATEDNKTSAEIKDSTLECNLEMSPSSPSLLLRNIDKQSAQLTESVNSLIPPLNLSPASSPVSCKACRHCDGITCSVLGGDESGSSNSSDCEESKKKHLYRNTQRVLSMDDTSARTRPLRMEHKHRLFSCIYDGGREVHRATAAHCKCCWPVSCEMCGPDNTTDVMDSKTTLEEHVALLDPCFHPVLSLHCDVPFNIHVQALLHNEDWNKQPFPSIKNELKVSLSNSTPCKSHTCEDALDSVRCNVYKDYYPKALGQHWNQSPSIPLRQRQQSECCYDIDNIVIPMSLVATSKIEKLQYKEIITPSWRIVAIKPLKGHIQGKLLEDLSDEAFALRHKNHEKREQARWFLWEQSRCHRKGGNRLSSFSKNNDEHLNPHLPASPENENQLNYSSSGCCVSEMAQSEETQDFLLEGEANAKVVLPWNCRMFPLSDEEIKCLTHSKVPITDNEQCKEVVQMNLRLFSKQRKLLDDHTPGIKLKPLSSRNHPMVAKDNCNLVSFWADFYL
ncbi:hypothetical protein scyTo_0010174 [Scyliorhinus torazame]|uniref:PEHE domain-containing protein n=1 Tax=Scyliorhinus torazame TaxID=75743 RepID=A0A401P1F6_SCYTO|nr:hypothetical protein [Scyliorhinus torazame]